MTSITHRWFAVRWLRTLDLDVQKSGISNQVWMYVRCSLIPLSITGFVVVHFPYCGRWSRCSPRRASIIWTQSNNKNVNPPNQTTTAARENQLTVKDFAPGVLTKSVAQIGETTGTGDGQDGDLLVAVSLSWTPDGLLKWNPRHFRALN